MDGIDLAEGDAVYIVLYATGVRHATTLACTIGGHPVTVAFAGPQGSFAGLDQINLLAPAVLKGAGRVDLVFTADGATANTVTVEFR